MNSGAGTHVLAVAGGDGLDSNTIVGALGSVTLVPRHKFHWLSEASWV